jgi:hypothetical protein
MTTVVISQPNYLPWLGYFERMARADIFVFLDDVQFERRSWHSRNRLRSATADPFWLTVPVKSMPRNTRIIDMAISDTNTTWRATHINSIRHSLGAAPHFSSTFNMLEKWLATDQAMLAELTISGTMIIANLLGLRPTFIRSSELRCVGTKSARLLELCNYVGATKYYSAAGSRDYLDLDLFARNSIAVEFQSWQHPPYRQCGSSFVPYLSAIDAIMNIGTAETRNLLLLANTSSSPKAAIIEGTSAIVRKLPVI